MPLVRRSQCLWSENLPVQDISSTFVTSPADFDLKRKHGWLHELHCKFEMQGRKVVMIVNNCPAHPEVSGVKAINLQFLPQNTTSCTQPIDRGVISDVSFIIYLFYKQSQSNRNRMFWFCCRRSSLFKKFYDY